MIYIEEAWRVLIANRTRSLLTMLGLIIGVGAVIAIQTLGSSMAGAVNGGLDSLTNTSFMVFPNGRQQDMAKAAIRLSDIRDVENAVPGIVASQPITMTTELVRAGHHQGRLTISGDGAVSFSNLPARFGRLLNQSDVDGARNVAVISDEAYQRLFPDGGDPTGKSLYAGTSRYRIVGVLVAPKRGLLVTSFSGSISIPWTTFVGRYVHGGTVMGATFIAADSSKIAALETQAQDELVKLHGNAKGIQYQAIDKASMTKGINGVFIAVTLVVALIGAVSLLVAGIGVMNIMLVSVAERTREIGVRKAIGARGGQVLLQFFWEALMLSVVGCGAGLLIGLAIGGAVNALLIVKLTGTITPLPWLQSLGIASGFALVVTLAFGTYPAVRASRLNPIEALRYE